MPFFGCLIYTVGGKMGTREKRLTLSANKLAIGVFILLFVFILSFGLGLERSFIVANADDVAWKYSDTINKNPLESGNGLTLEVGTDPSYDSSGVYYEYKNVMSIENDFVSSDGNALAIISPSLAIKNYHITQGDTFNNSFTLSANIPILETIGGKDNLLVKAIKDNLIVVDFVPYIVQVTPMNQDIQDSCLVTTNYYTGVEGDFVSSGPQVVTFYSEISGGEKEYSYTGASLNGKNYMTDESYLNVTFSEFAIGGYESNTNEKLGIGIKEMGVKVRVRLNKDIVFDEVVNAVAGGTSIEIVDAKGTRAEDAEFSVLKKGDHIVVDSKLLYNQKIVGENTEASSDWDFYRELFFAEGIWDDGRVCDTDYMIKWSFNSSVFQQVYELDYTNKEGENVSLDLNLGDNRETMPTGGKAIFKVLDVQLNDSTTIRPYLSRFDGGVHVEMEVNNGFDFRVDNNIPNAPAMDTTTGFYKRYFEEKNFYTEKSTFVYKTFADGTKAPKTINIDGTNFAMQNNVLELLDTDSPLNIYYRVTKYDSDPGLVHTTNNFDINSSGVEKLARVTKNGVVYYNFALNMFDGDEEVKDNYFTEAYFSIEFLASDDVGNFRYGINAEIFRVDVKEYTFSISTLLSDEVIDIGREFSLQYGVIGYGATIASNFKETPTFMRGEKILVKPKFTSSGRSKYILTTFLTGGGDVLSTSEYKFNNDNSIFLNPSQVNTLPTFTLNNNYLEDSNLTMTFKLKNRVNLTASNTTAQYDGTQKLITPTAKIGNNVLPNVGISVTYAKTKYEGGKYVIDGDYMSPSATFPVNAGKYLYRCEVTNDSSYGVLVGENNILTIVQATPIIEGFGVSSIKYGESLESRDALYINGQSEINTNIYAKYLASSNIAFMKGEYYSGVSSDGVPGYYVVDSPEKDTPRYNLPEAGNFEITYNFIPVKCRRSSDNKVQYIEINGNFVVDYLFDENGNYIRDENYSIVRQSGILKISYNKNVTCKIDGILIEQIDKLSKVYSGEEYSANVVVNGVIKENGVDKEIVLDSDFIIKEYCTIDDFGNRSEFSQVAPTNVGKYIVRVRINHEDIACNFQGSWEKELTIEKMDILVKADNYKYVYQNGYKITNIYGYFLSSTGDEIVPSDIDFDFTYYYYISGSEMVDMAVESNIVGGDNLINGLPNNVGKYLVDIKVNANNYINYQAKYIILEVTQVLSSDADYIVTFPSIGYNDIDKTYHLFYKQPLSYANINVNTLTYAKYQFQKENDSKKETKRVEGEYLLTTALYNNSEDLTEFVNREQAKEFTTVGDKDLYLYFIPSSDNFAPVYRRVTIEVGKAKPIFDDLVPNSIIYTYIIDSFESLDFDENNDNIKIQKDKDTYMVVDKSVYDLSLVLPDGGVRLDSGRHNIEVKFLPKEAYSAYYAEGSGYILVEVEKKVLSDNELILSYSSSQNIESQESVYRMKYNHYIQPNIAVLPSYLGGEFSYAKSQEGIYEDYDYASNGSKLSVGSYKVTYNIINDNYEGSASIRVDILKDDTLSVVVAPSIQNEIVAVSYGKNISDINFIGGQVRNDRGLLVDGKYTMGYTSTTFDRVGKIVYDLNFLPTDTNNYKELNIQGVYTVNVNKADVSSFITIALNKFVYGTNINTNNIFETLDYSDIYGSEYNIYVDSQLLTAQGRIIDAGEHIIKFELDNPNYKCSVTDTLVVDKQKVIIEITKDKKPYSAYNQEVDYEVYKAVESDDDYILGDKLEDFTLLHNYFDYTTKVQLAKAPVEIGKYDAKLYVNNNNYEYCLGDYVNTSLTISVDSSYSVINLEQTYSLFDSDFAPKFLRGQNNANASLYYYDEANDEYYYDNMPADSGEYEVYIKFSPEYNNGYEDVILYEEKLVVAKFLATINLQDINIYYTGNIFKYNIWTDPNNLNYKVEYAKVTDSIIGEYSSSQPLDASEYKLRVTIKEENYVGEKIVDYIILPAKLTLVQHTTFGDYSYNSTIAPLVSSEGRFSYNGNLVSGESRVDLESINTKNTGSQMVTYTFVPNNANYASTTTTTQIKIIKSVINEEYIKLSTLNVYNTYYNAKEHKISVILNKVESDVSDYEGIIFDANNINNDIVITILYDDTANPAIEIGEYTLGCSISSQNYTGSKSFVTKLVVDRGNPYIGNIPTLKSANYTINSLIPTDLLNADGRAYIEGTHEAISGSFELNIEDNQTFDKANINKIPVKFTPTNTDLFNIVYFFVEVNVEGNNGLVFDNTSEFWNKDSLSLVYDSVNVSNAKIIVKPNSNYPLINNELVYGVKISQLLIFISEDNGASISNNYTNFGKLEFVGDDKIIDVDEEITVKFTPYGDYIDSYNIMYGKVKLDIVKAEPIDWEVEVIAVKNQLIQNSKITITNGDSSIVPTEVLFYSDENYNNLLTSSWTADQEVYIKIKSKNFNDYKVKYSVKVLNGITDNNITINNNAKDYDKEPIDIEDLGVVLGVSVNLADVKIKVFDSENNDVTGIAYKVGIYSIVLEAKNQYYYGVKTFEFAITKSDLSEVIELSHYTTAYNVKAKPSVTLYGQTLSSEEYKMQFKREFSSDSNYTYNMFSDGGIYDLRVSIDTDNYFAEKVFKFEIEPQKLSFIGKAVCEQTYGKAIASLDTVIGYDFGFKSKDNTVIAVNYVIKYYSDSYTISELVPTTAGSYKARIIITNSNYKFDTNNGYYEVDFVINKQKTTINNINIQSYKENNTDYNIKYGQTLNDVVIKSGEARDTQDSVVEGEFRFKTPDFHPEVGTNNYIVVFYPHNSNFATSEKEIKVTVTKGQATVVFDNLYTYYDGTQKGHLATYTIFPSNVRIMLTFTNSSNYQVSPVEAGNYIVNVQSLDSNYNVVVSDGEGSTLLNTIFVIRKAQVKMDNEGNALVVSPKAKPIMCGESLLKSELTAPTGYGNVFYNGFNNPVNGTFSYVQSAMVYKNKGTYSVKYLFMPEESHNYEQYIGEVNIQVNAGFASIKVSDNELIYGEGFRLPTFTTQPENLEVRTNIDIVEGSILDVKVYRFTAWIVTDNYFREENAIEFSISIRKKELDIDFVDSAKNVVSQYKTNYGEVINALIKLYPNDNPYNKSGYLAKDAITNGVRIEDSYVLRYKSIGTTASYDSHIPPINRGTYSVSVELNNNNYIATKEIFYTIDRGIIREVSFDSNLLENQIYGNTVAPKVNTIPSDIDYYISYQGYNLVKPDDVGTYNITVYFNDDNYEKRQVSAIYKINPKVISVVDIKVNDKTYDGVPTLIISGKLQGVLPEDIVLLTMEATTVDKKSNAGSHNVDITNYQLMGLHADNYELIPPKYLSTITIFDRKVESATNAGYVTNQQGFNNGTSMTVNEIYSKENSVNFINKLMGVSTRTIVYNIYENGADTILQEQVKVYILIPEEYRGKDFTVQGAGNLAGKDIIFTKEGNYISFYTTNTGGVVFSYKEFKLAPMVIASAILVIIIGIFVLVLLNPMHRRKMTEDPRLKKEAIKKIKRMKRGDFWER